MYKALIAVCFMFLVGCGQKAHQKVAQNESVGITPTAKVEPKVEFTEVESSQKSVLAGPKVTYDYKLGVMVEKTRVYEKVKYPDGEKTVPIINGYIPKIFETTFANGDTHIVYDYRQRVVYQPNKVDSN